MAVATSSRRTGTATLARTSMSPSSGSPSHAWRSRAKLADSGFRWSDAPFRVGLPVAIASRNGFQLSFTAGLVGSTVHDDAGHVVVDLVASEPVVLGPADPPAAAWVSVHMVNCHDFMGSR